MEILFKLVDSKSKALLLSKLLDRLNANFSISELGKLSNLPKATVSFIINQWEKTGIVLSRYQGRNKLVSLNSNFYLLPELRKIFEKMKNFQKPLIDELNALPVLKKSGVKAVVVFGSRARDDFTQSSDLDVLVVVDDKNSSITERIVEEFVGATKKTSVRFSPVLLDKSEVKNRLKEKDKFIISILAEGKILKGGKFLEHLQTAS
ncbi:MAG: winged helix-turn-helix domain-containing protein [Candidatus Diapherotrites archaeon]|nr:winged helix-turn-helix domain-containing protein [Candidatus Diapherotrites archaeon]